MAGAPQAPEITCEDLIRTVESGAPIRVLDVRAPSALSGGRIEIVPPERFVNIRGSAILSLGEAVASELPVDGPIAVVCGQGNSSKQIALHLNELGYHARSLRGGMTAWNDALASRALGAPAGFDHLVQFDRVAKGNLGYLVAAGGEALLVDVPRKPQPYLDKARELGLKVIGVADTHVHADYLSGGPAVARSLKVPYYIHPADGVSPYDGTPATIPYTPLQDGQKLRVGPAEIRVEHTPGHTEGSVCYWIGNRTALTGDFIFIRSVGRPDLGGKLGEWTPVLWRSIERARRTWPAETQILPAHYGSELERADDRSVARAFGKLPEENEPLRIASEPEFVAWVNAKVGSIPDAYRKIKTVNLGLLQIWEMEAQELEGGKNACALG